MATDLQILMYHQVGQFPSMREHRATYCQVESFRRQMAMIKHLGWSVLHLSDAIRRLRQGELPPRSLCLTFDDGYENFLELALPILQSHGFPATVYVLPTLLGQNADWLAESGHPTPRLMSLEQLRTLPPEVSIGSHGLRHVRLAEQPIEMASRDLLESKSRLEDALGQAVTSLCYPYGSYSLAVVRAAQSAGYETAVTCVRAKVTAADHPLLLPRKAVSQGDHAVGLLFKLLFKHTPSANTAALYAETRAQLQHMSLAN